ncbi:uncharacterized protein LOC141638058 [Silene latifolia]|uniref:uncharacterized protein LOC141638058 n=1 Tax=Silene latifolia TaxID=37657 RepID=UPI003D772E96
MYQLVCKLKALKGPLKQLNSANSNDIENNTSRARMNLEYIQEQIRDDPFNPDLIQQELEASSSVRWMEKACNDFLLQKSKATWVDIGDNNTKYFHSIIKGKQVRNKVLRIEDSAGRLCDEPATIQSAFLDFYTSLLGSSDEEIKEVMFSIPVHKAAGPDGYTSAFFRDSWDIVGGTDIIRMYNRKSVSPRVLLKVDLKKAYDSVSWRFLEEMMTTLNFPGQFIGLVMECVKTATYSLMLNGDIFEFFKGEKGLRQGDPLSPLLFTIAMEYLSRVLTYVTDTMKFKYYPLCAPLKLSHLMFTNDLLLFSKGDVSSIMVLLRAFATFSKAYGLLMSPFKTSAYFNGVDAGVK